MSTRHLIKQDLFTNSLLISPIANEQAMSSSIWVKKNSIFSTFKEKHINSYIHQPYYQCSLLDYLSTIQLVITEKNGSKIIYEYGPLQLQHDLIPVLRSTQHTFHVRVLFSKREVVDGKIILKKDHNHVKMCFLLENGLQFDVLYPYYDEDDDYESLFKIQESESTMLEINCMRDKRLMVTILKKLKIYSYQGNFLKLSFKNPTERDNFFINLLRQAGFDFQPKTKAKQLNQLSQLKTQQSQNKENQLLQMTPISFISPPPHDNTLNDICQILSIQPTQKQPQNILIHETFEFDNHFDTSVSQIHSKHIIHQPQSIYSQKGKKKINFNAKKQYEKKNLIFQRKKTNFQYISPQKQQTMNTGETQKNKQQCNVPEFIRNIKVNHIVQKTNQESKTTNVLPKEPKLTQFKNNFHKQLDERYSSNSPVKLHSRQKMLRGILKPEQQPMKESKPLYNIKSIGFLPKYNGISEKIKKVQISSIGTHFRKQSNFNPIS